MRYETKYGHVEIYAQTVDNETVSQVIQMANSPLGEDAHIRVMPDCHAGKGCVIGTTMRITDKVCPNLVGVDIGCGVTMVATEDLHDRLDELDAVIRQHVPYGHNVHPFTVPYYFSNLACWDKLDKRTQDLSQHSFGTLGGGNHFVEAYSSTGPDRHSYLAVHSGSRNIGLKVASYYQDLAEQSIRQKNRAVRREEMLALPPQEREAYVKSHTVHIDRELSYLTGQDMRDYLHDMSIIQRFAEKNRRVMLQTICSWMKIKRDARTISTTHNYIDVDGMILRKGAVSARYDETFLLPLNMRDGMLVCKGKGNPEWNQSAPHGAGRLYSRHEAKRRFSVDEFADAMKGVYTTCVSSETLDEAPFAYKDGEEIMRCIEPTARIIARLSPIYNFKAN